MCHECVQFQIEIRKISRNGLLYILGAKGFSCAVSSVGHEAEHLTQNTTATATRMPRNKTFNEQNNSCASEL